MGREAECDIRWGNETGRAKVLLEGSELIVRGDVRRRVPFSALDEVSVRGDGLVFSVEGVPIALGLGVEKAQAWMEAIRTPPPSLARKLGITADSRVLAWGPIDTKVASVSGALTGLRFVKQKREK